MDKAGIIRRNDEIMMREYGRRCHTRLNRNILFRLIMPLFCDFMEANVAKELEKDAIIVTRAAAAFERGSRLEDGEVEGIFEMTKAVDRAFVIRMSVPLLTIKIPYEDIKAIRMKRIAILHRLVFDLLSDWKESLSFTRLIQRTFTPGRFRETIIDILHLYNLETRVLGSSVKLLPVADGAKNRYAHVLYTIMEDESKRIADEFTEKIFGDANTSCPDPT